MHDEPFLFKFPCPFIAFHGLLWCYRGGQSSYKTTYLAPKPFGGNRGQGDPHAANHAREEQLQPEQIRHGVPDDRCQYSTHADLLTTISTRIGVKHLVNNR